MTMINTVTRFRQLNDLVGRDGEIQLLKDAYQRVRDSPSSCEVVLLHGESGVGKTALVNQTFLHKRESGTMISGKFDIIHSTRPYSAIVDALTQLCQRATWNNISDVQELLADLHKRFCTGDLKVLSHLIPAVKPRLKRSLNVINENEEESTNDEMCDPVSIDNTFAFARLADVVRSFLFLVAGYLPSPLVLFLDDVQAADQESLSIISSLTSLHSESLNLLLILAYRDETEGPQLKRSDLLSHTSDFQVTDITVGNLDVNYGNKLIAMLLGMDPEETYSLSCLIAERTGGNIYFSMQFLKMLKDEKLLDYSFANYQWEWNLEKIRVGTNVTEHVAMLLTSKIQQLPPDVQSALQLAACLGFYFDIGFLERINMQERAVIIDVSAEFHLDSEKDEGPSPKEELKIHPFSWSIERAVEEHLIEPAGGTKYKFTHDRVFQASYEMIPAGRERNMLHWRIGKVLWSELNQQRHQHQEMQNQGETSDGWLLFTAADQLNRGIGAFTSNVDSVTPLTLARLNLDAGKAACEKSAFKYAASFYDKGVKSLQGMWQSKYSLCLELHTRSAEAEHVASNFDHCDQRISDIIQHGRCLEDRLPAYLVKIRSLGVRGRLLEALDESVAVLRLVGEQIPRHPNRLQMLLELRRTKKALKGKNIPDLVALPEMTASLKIWATKFLQSAAIFSWFARDNELFFVASNRMMQLTVNYGVSSQGPCALAVYGVTLGLLGDLETANEVGKVSLVLAKRPHTMSSYSSTISIVSGFLNHLKQPVTRSLDLYMDGYNAGLKIGDVEGAALCISAYAILGTYVGKKLDVVLSEMEGFRQAYREECDRNFTMILSTPFHQLVLNLMGKAENPLKLAGAVLCGETYLTEARRTGNEVAKATFAIANVVLLYIFGDVEATSNILAKLDLRSFRGTHYRIPFVLMYAGLTMLGMARKTRNRIYLRRANLFKRIMLKFAKAGNLNMPPMLKLMLAEQASLGRHCRPEDVKKAYELAVRVAAQSGFSVVEAIGYERAGEYMLSNNDTFWAKTYLSRALLLYDEWGAVAKTQQMLEKHTFLANVDRPSFQSVSLTLRKRYSYKATTESQSLSLT